MEFGFSVPLRGPLANVEAIRSLAARGEALGFAVVAVPDHILIPTDIGSRYPYSGSGDFPGRVGGDTLEQLAVMATVAALTERVRVLSSVMVIPHRPPAQTAKALTTIDVLSGGRVVLGVGAGWMREEFEAIGAPDFAARGRVTDEYLEAMKELWTAEAPRFDGEFVHFDNVCFLPRPVQRPHPPIWVGGESPAAMRRTVRLGDAWYPIGVNPRHPLDTLDRFRAALETLRALSETAGRDPASIEINYWANWYHEDRLVKLDDGQRQLFTGSDAQLVEDVQAMRELGVRHLLFNFQRADLGASLAAMERFKAQVLDRA